MDACLDLIHNHSDILVGIQDMGAAGLVSSSSEMTLNTSFGFDVIFEGNNAQLFSETQLRFIVTVKAEHAENFETLAKEQQISISQLGQVTENGNVTISSSESTSEFKVNEIQEQWNTNILNLLQ